MLKTLYRPVGAGEWKLIEEAGRRAFPPRLDWQPIFYPVLNFRYAADIARDWNTTDELSGFVGVVTKFDVDAVYLRRFDEQVVGAAHCRELWVPAEEMAEFNRHIHGNIRVAAVYRGAKYEGPNIAVDDPEP